MEMYVALCVQLYMKLWIELYQAMYKTVCDTIGLIRVSLVLIAMLCTTGRERESPPPLIFPWLTRTVSPIIRGIAVGTRLQHLTLPSGPATQVGVDSDSTWLAQKRPSTEPTPLQISPNVWVVREEDMVRPSWNTCSDLSRDHGGNLRNRIGRKSETTERFKCFHTWPHCHNPGTSARTNFFMIERAPIHVVAVQGNYGIFWQDQFDLVHRTRRSTSLYTLWHHFGKTNKFSVCCSRHVFFYDI